jgi:hypothetical protein
MTCFPAAFFVATLLLTTPICTETRKLVQTYLSNKRYFNIYTAYLRSAFSSRGSKQGFCMPPYITISFNLPEIYYFSYVCLITYTALDLCTLVHLVRETAN